MTWHVQYTDSARSQLAGLAWEEVERAEEAVRQIALTPDPTQYGAPVGDFQERRCFAAPPVQMVAWAAEAIKTLTVVEIVFPDALTGPVPEPVEEPPQEETLDTPRHVPSWVTHPLGVFEKESELAHV